MAAKGFVQPDAPQLPKTPMDLFTLREGEGFTLWDRYCVPVVSGIGGFIAPMFRNIVLRRPVWAGAWLHVSSSLGFYAIGDIYIRIRMKVVAENNAVLKHYITLHPEDFPPYDRTQIKYLYMPWRPYR